MALSPTHSAARDRIRRLCYAGLGSQDLRLSVLAELRAATAIDGAFFPTVDPASLFYTSAVVQGMPTTDTARYLDNELVADDVNKFRDLARRRRPTATLDAATQGSWASSARSREIMGPSGHGDELRAAFRTGSTTWGVLCLHRAVDAPVFSPADVELVTSVGSDIAEGLRRSLLVSIASVQAADDAPGVLTIAPDLTVIAATPAGEHWLAELHEGDLYASPALPTAVLYVVRAVRALRAERSLTPRLTVPTLAGRWLTLHASYLDGASPDGAIAVVIEPASAPALQPVLIAAFALSDREAAVFTRVLRGLPTKAISRELRISAHTVNDHLKAIFTKAGVSSRGELMATAFRTAAAAGPGSS